MSRTPSTMIPLGTIAPDFSLPEPSSGRVVTLAQVRGQKGTLIMFICNHCPFVIHVNEELVRLGHEYPAKGVNLVAINANDIVNYPEDSPEKMTEVASRLGYDFPYLYDETQEVARAYDAACTPDLFLFDKNLKLVYRGQLDGARPGNEVPVTGEDLRQAIEALLNNEEIPTDQKPSLGCNIKWKV